MIRETDGSYVDPRETITLAETKRAWVAYQKAMCEYRRRLVEVRQREEAVIRAESLYWSRPWVSRQRMEMFYETVREIWG